MRFLSHRPAVRAGVFAVAFAAGTSGFVSPVLAGQSAAVRATAPAAAGPVSTTPASGTPHLTKQSGKATERVRQLVQCGGMMYAVGKITTVLQGGKSYTRHNAFSFRATAPYTMSGWNPNVNGEVDSIAFSPKLGCSHAYIGGSFTKVNGKKATNIAEVSTSTGALAPGFGRSANNEVFTLLGYHGHLLVGGKFTHVNGSSHAYYASLNPNTGKDDGFLNLHVSGHVKGFPTLIYNQQLSHQGNQLLAEGNFTSVDGKSRQQIFMLDLSTSHASVTGWTSPQFSQHCVTRLAFYVRAAAWSPSDSTVYVADTGFHIMNWDKKYPLSGLCDAVAALPASHTSVSPKWVNYTGCDSSYSVAADGRAVYAGGHMRWTENKNGCNFKGPGALADRGLWGLYPGKGQPYVNKNGTTKYHMSRANADDMLLTSAGLWIASENRFGSDNCGGVGGHAGICFLPHS